MELSEKTLTNLFGVLRTLNLAVTAISVGLLSNVELASNQSTPRAAVELKDLIEIQKKAASSTGNELLSRAAKQDFQDVTSWDVTLTKNGDSKLTVSIPSIVTPAWVSETDLEFPILSPESRARVKAIFRRPLGEFATIHEFQEFFDYLGRMSRVLVPDPSTLRAAPGHSGSSRDLYDVREDNLRYQIGEPPIDNPDITVSSISKRQKSIESTVLSWDEYNQSASLAAYWRSFNDTTIVRVFVFYDPDADALDGNSHWPQILYKPLSLRLHLSAKELNIDPLRDLLELNTRVPYPAQFLGFNSLFPNLGELPQHYKWVPLEELKDILTEESRETKAELELFGTKVPNELFVVFGLPCLAIILFQFASICSFIASRVDEIELDTASEWSFLLDGSIFNFLRYGTTLFLPLMATVLSVMYATHGSSKWLLWYSLVALVFAGSVQAALNLQRLSAKVQIAKVQIAKPESTPDLSGIFGPISSKKD